MKILICFILLCFSLNSYSQNLHGILKYSSCFSNFEEVINESNFESMVKYNTFNISKRKTKKILKLIQSSKIRKNELLMDCRIKIEFFNDKDTTMVILLENNGHFIINNIQYEINIDLLREIHKIIPNSECWEHLFLKK